MGPKPTADKKVKKCLNLFDHGGLVGLGGLGRLSLVGWLRWAGLGEKLWVSFVGGVGWVNWVG